jgi:hypothetical protein
MDLKSNMELMGKRFPYLAKYKARKFYNLNIFSKEYFVTLYFVLNLIQLLQFGIEN